MTTLELVAVIAACADTGGVMFLAVEALLERKR